MKKLLLAAMLGIALTVAPAAVRAQPAPQQPAPVTGTKLTDAETQQYYKNCMTRSQADQTMKPQTKDVHCQCTAIHMQRVMSMEDIRAMTGNDQPARNAINKVLIYVYAPCMQYPVRDLIANRCDKEIGKPAICNCVSDKMSAYTASEAQRLLGSVLAQNQNITDPMGAIMETPDFKSNEKRLAMSCAQLIGQ